MTTYFTKCGKPFEKSGSAVVTGYHIEGDEFSAYDGKCVECPFIVSVKEGWPEQKHKRWECRAGSLPPSHLTEWRGNLNDKNTLNIYSLDVKFMTEVITYAQNHPDLSAAYNADSMADCRRTISVSCSGNKKGMTAKKELIDKFFPSAEEDPEARPVEAASCANCRADKNDCEPYITCMNEGLGPEECLCKNWIPVALMDGEEICDDCGNYRSTTADIGTCSLKKIAVSRIRPACEDYGPREVEGDDEEELSALDLEDQLNTLLETGDKADRAAKENALQCGSCGMGHWYSYKHTYVSVVQSDGMTTVKSPCEPETHYCNNFVEGRKKIASDTDFDPETAPDWCPRRPKEQELFQEPETAVSETVKSVIETAENVSEHAESVPDAVKPVELEQVPIFDYSELDDKTAEFLRLKAKNISDIKVRTVHDIGLELKLAHDTLANNKTGTFGAWCESIGINRRTAENYIQAFEYITKNFRNIEDAAGIQPSLLFAASKPSAPPELAQAVIDGDITKHKDYIAALKEMNEAKEWGKKQADYADEHMKRAREAEFELSKKDTAIKALQSDLEFTKGRMKHLEAAVPDARELDEKRNQIENLENEIGDLREQLSAKPIEAPAVEIKEVVPESLEIAWAANLQMAIYQLAELTDDEIIRMVKRLGLNNYAVLKDDMRTKSHRAKSRLEKLADVIFSAPAPADTFIKWAKEEPTDDEV